jgi:DNA-binding Lrp family transcriptional regulator
MAFGEMPKRDDLEHRALQIIIASGKQGILQCDLWRALGASSREGSRIALKLERKGLIRRDQELYDGRWTYRLYAKRQPASIDSILDVPCVACPDLNKCGVGGVPTPATCELINNWILKLMQAQPQSEN